MYYIIYEITNTKNGMKYIGKHITENIHDGYMGSGLYLKKAIKKYGKNTFRKEILFTFDNEVDMENKEKELVNKNIILDDNYYNISLGGQGGITVLYPDHPMYNDTCKKISEAQKKRKKQVSEITKELHKQKKVGMYGKKQSDNQKQVVSAKLKGVPKNIKSVEKQKQSLMKTLNSDGYIHPNTGRKATPEQLKRMSEETRNRPKKTCGYCNKILDPANYAKYHGEKCNKKKSIQL
jgi:hypothetical protein